MAYFPVFMDINDQICLVVGGGTVALRKVEKLQEYGARVRVIAKEILPQIKELPGLAWQERTFEETDLTDVVLVVAATDDAAENHRIAECCRTAKVPVNAVDQIEDCSFLFSSMVRQGDVVAAVSSGGKSPILTQYLKKKIAQVLTERVGEANDLLGEWRPYVKAEFATEARRKPVFKALFERCLEGEELPEEQEILRLIASFKK